MGTGSQIITKNKFHCKKNVEIRPFYKDTTFIAELTFHQEKLFHFFSIKSRFIKTKIVNIFGIL